MADISTYLAAILAAVYGEDVRGSIHDAIEIINDVSEVVLTTGTAVTSASSSSTGFYKDSLYLNTNTFELWKCMGTDTWASQGILKGNNGVGISGIAKTSTSGLVDTYTITFDDGSTETFDVTNGADGQNGSKWYKGTAISGTGTSITGFPGVMNDFYLNSSDGYVYICTKTGGSLPPDAAEWDYVMTLTGGGGSSVTVVDNLTSTSSTDALSANQGRALNEKKQEKFNSYSAGLKEEMIGPVGSQTLQLSLDLLAGSNISLHPKPSGAVEISSSGGGGDTVSWNQIQGSTGATKIAEININGNLTDVYAPNGGGGEGMRNHFVITAEAGATVTCTTPSGDVITCTQVSGSTTEWECDTDEYGIHTFTATIGGDSSTTTKDVETVGYYEITIYWNLDLATWITAAGLDPTDYPTFASVEADEKAVRQLMTIHAAVDYLATCSKTNDALVTDIISSNVCAKWINLRDYALDTLYANAIIKTMMDSADKYFYGEWCIVDDTTTPATWGPKIATAEMTDNSLPFGVVTASTDYTGDSHAKWKAFSDPSTNANVGWGSTTTGASAEGWLQYEFLTPICIKKFGVLPKTGTYTDSFPKKVTLKGSNDGTNFVPISETFSTVQPSTNGSVVQSFACNSNQYYKYIRLECTDGIWNTDRINVNKLFLYGRFENNYRGEYDWDTTDPRHYLYDHGVYPNESVDLVNGAAAPAPVYEENDIYIKTGTPQGGSNYTGMCTTNAIDLTPYTDIKTISGRKALNIASQAGEIDALSQKFTTTYNDSYKVAKVNLVCPYSSREQALSVSSITQSLYVYIGNMYEVGRIISVSEMWLE